MRRHSLTITATTLNFWVCPGGVTEVELEGYGGGSSGSTGGHADDTQNLFAMGGPGGAGSLMYRTRVPVTPGVSYDGVIGSGGAATSFVAGTSSTIPDPGIDGGDTLFRINGGATLATFQGAMAPSHVAATTGCTVGSVIVHGGVPTRQTSTGADGDQTFSNSWITTDFNTGLVNRGPNCGGRGHGNLVPVCGGQDSVQGYLGGFGGTNGTNSTGYKGGGGGGGGGAGPGGNGGTGGAGGNAFGAGAFGEGGTGGGDAAASTGAGGGGGGGAGAGGLSGGGSSGGISGGGGSGKLTITWYV